MVKTGKSATMSDVAKRAGVSPMTVSRAFKSDASVNAETRARILEAAEDLGYILDSTASNLRSQKTGFLAVTIPSINNANFAETVGAMTAALRDTGLQVLLGYTNYDVDEEERLIAQLLGRRPEAIVVTGGTHTPRTRKLLENAGIPVIETWDLPAQPLGHVVGFSNAEAARMMVRHFVAQGFSRLGFIGGDASRDTRGLDRRQGFFDELAKLGLDTARHVASGPPPITMREGATCMAEMLERWPDTQAVMCVSDPVAFGALTECQRRGLSVPQQMAIGGFGAYDISEQSLPRITTVDVSAAEIGVQTAQMIEALLLRGPEAVPMRHVITPRILARETS